MLLAFIISLLSPLMGTFVTLDVHVVDETGAPVPNASVCIWTLKRLGINAGGASHDFRSQRRMTDANGNSRFSIYCVANDVDCSVSAEDFDPFHRKVEYKATVNGPLSFSMKFQERSKRLECVLRRTPVPEKIIVSSGMAGKAFKAEKGSFGFDLMKNDWVPPHGHGRTADFWIDYERFGKTGEVLGRIHFRERGAGCYVVEREALEAGPGTCVADTNAVYSGSMAFHSPPFGDRKTKFVDVLAKKDCLVMRTRVTCDDSGNIASAHYSVVRGAFYFQNSMHMGGYMFNTRPNDTNLEFKGPVWR